MAGMEIDMIDTKRDPFDFGDSLDDVFGGVAAPAPAPAPVVEDEDEHEPAPREYQENCRKCNGRGKFVSYTGRVVGNCFACEGRGFRTYKNSSVDRAKAREQRAARVERVKAEGVEAFAQAYPLVWAWIEAKRERFDFARAMRDAVEKFGSLTEKQLETCERLRLADEERNAKFAAERAAREAAAPVVEIDRLMAAFDAARESGLKHPKMRFKGFVASPAPATGKNLGAVYLKDGETYLGKIVGGRFQASRDCDETRRAAIVATMADPLAAAVAYGRRTGSCSICARELTNAESIERGIGPICAEKFGF